MRSVHHPQLGIRLPGMQNAGGAGGVPTFNFDSSLATFTEGMAKRAGALFAGAPIVQSKQGAGGTGDSVIVSSGTQISGNFYPNIDTTQGTICLLWTPEFSRDASYPDEFLFVISAFFRARYRHDNQNIVFQFGFGASCTTSLTTVAGTTYSIVLRWDTKGTLDGTNYGCISVNDSHEFGDSAITGVLSPSSSYDIGSGTGVATCNGILEGFTIYRRPLFDGTYGVDVGNGDEIAAIYNSGSFKDPCEVTGSWDVVLCLPTNATTGALTTGTGEAWSHPHSSGLLTDQFAQTAFASSAWSQEGTPVIPTSLEVVEASEITVDAGSEATIDNLFAADCTIEGWGYLYSGTSSGQRAFAAKTNVADSGWFFYLDSGAPRFRIYTSQADVAVGSGTYLDQWFHYALDFNSATSTMELYINGASVGTQVLSAAAADDAARTMILGGTATTNRDFDGKLGWFRISNNRRYTSGFTPTPRTSPPADDANTVRLFKMDEGTGTTIGDSSTNAQNATAGASQTWNTVADIATDSPDQRIFNWGYVLGSDAANEGIYQDVTVVAGDDWVIRVLAHSDGTSQPKAILYDQTGTAEIGSLLGTTTSTKSDPDVLIFTGTAPVGSTTLRVKVVNAAASGTMYLHQVELLTNKVQNPSMEGGAGDPYIPTGWTNANLDAGESSQETTVVHSGANSLKFEAAANSNEGIAQGFVTSGISTGTFLGMGVWIYGNFDNSAGGVGAIWLNSGARQISLSATSLIASNGASWKLLHGLYRYNGSNAYRHYHCQSTGTAANYIDDSYVYPLDAVSLTVTPATEASSTEAAGLRVDGRDTLTQPITDIEATQGIIQFTYTPRHDSADVSKFGNSTPRIALAYKSGTDYIVVYHPAASRVELIVSVGGVAGVDTNLSVNLTAGTTYACKIQYDATDAYFYIDDVEICKASPAGGIDFGANIPDTMYWGTNNSGGQQADAVFGATA